MDSKHHLAEEDFEELNESEEQAGMKRHHCTDLMCLVIYLLAIGGVVYLASYGAMEGDMRRLYAGYNFTGGLCGAGDQDGKDFLFWCSGQDNKGLDLEHPICVESCPADDTGNNLCFSGMVQEPMVAKRTAGKMTLKEETSYIFSAVNNYPTKPFLARYCLPTETARHDGLLRALNRQPLTRLTMEISQLTRMWLPLSLAALIAFVLGYLYLFLLHVCAKCFVCVASFFLIVGNIAAGFVLLVLYFSGGSDGVADTGDGDWNLLLALALFGVAGFFAALFCCFRRRIDVAIGCVEAATLCMKDMLSLVLEPAIAMVLKATTFVVLAFGFLLLASVGKVETMSLAQYASKYEGAAKVPHGVFRSFEYKEDQYWLMFFYLFTSVWIVQTITALTHFVLSYSVQVWYFTPYNDEKKDSPSCPLPRAYYIGIFYHTGTLAMGAFLVTVLAIPRFILGVFVRDHSENGICACCGRCCLCLLACFQRWVEFVSKSAYMDVAINSSTFCTAARNALHVLTAEMPAVAILNGATWFFSVTGCALISGAGAVLVFFMVTKVAYFSDEDSDHHIQDPIMASVLAAIVCLIIAFGFMAVFDTVSDTILYCYAVEERRKQKGLMDVNVQCAPKRLDKIIEESSGAEDSHTGTFG